MSLIAVCFWQVDFLGKIQEHLYDIMQFTEDNKIPGMVVFIDFENAFDSMSWKFIDKILDYLNFGHDIRKLVNILNMGAKTCVMQNGISSEFFNTARGCRQGDPISPYIFCSVLKSWE